MSETMSTESKSNESFQACCSVLLCTIFVCSSISVLMSNSINPMTYDLDDLSVEFKSSNPASNYLSSVPKLGIAGLEIMAYHSLSDEALIHGNSSYSIANTATSEIVDGANLYPSQDYMNGQYRSLNYCIISGKNGNSSFNKVLSASGTDVHCEVLESFEHGIRIVGTVACDSNPCPGSNNAFNLSWNGTVDFSRSCTGCFFILDLDWNGSFARVNTISVNGVSSSTNCQMPSIVDATVSPNNSTFLLTRHSKNGHYTSSNYPCNWSPTGSTPSWSAASHSHILWMHNSSGVGNWWVKTGYNADDVYVGISDRFAKLVPSESTDSVYVVGESGVGSTNAACGKSPITTSCHFH